MRMLKPAYGFLFCCRVARVVSLFLVTTTNVLENEAMDNTQPATPVPGDEEIRGRINYFTAQLRKAGLLGATAAEVGQDREPSSDPASPLTGGLGDQGCP